MHILIVVVSALVGFIIGGMGAFVYLKTKK